MAKKPINPNLPMTDPVSVNPGHLSGTIPESLKVVKKPVKNEQKLLKYLKGR